MKRMAQRQLRKGFARPSRRSRGQDAPHAAHNFAGASIPFSWYSRPALSGSVAAAFSRTAAVMRIWSAAAALCAREATFTTVPIAVRSWCVRPNSPKLTRPVSRPMPTPIVAASAPKACESSSRRARQSSWIFRAAATACAAWSSCLIGKLKIYPVHTNIRNLAGRITRKLSVTESQNSAHLLGTSWRRKLRMSSANSRHVR